nr:glycosyltransferase [uncultured Butyrivibrio sp.]
MDNKLPILLFKGDESLCYGIMTEYSQQLRNALMAAGENVIYLDPKEDEVEPYIDKHYKAVIAFMENIFYMVLPNGDFVFDHFYGPKFNYWTDHPAFYYRYVQKVPKDYYILTQDRSYVKYINRYYKQLQAFYLPPGGKHIDDVMPFSERKYDLSFVGTYWPGEVENTFNKTDETTRIIMDSYLKFLMNEPDYTAEEAFEIVLEKLGAHLTDDQFAQEFSKVHRLASRGVARYFRQKIIERIVDSGITIDVFGDSWKEATFANNSNLRIHPEVTSDKISEIYNSSKMSLNVMTWHKDSITERVLDSMMAGSIALSDQTPALRENFTDGEEIVLFSLKEIERIPERIRKYLSNEEVANRGREKVLQSFSWDNCARRLLEIIDEL